MWREESEGEEEKEERFEREIIEEEVNKAIKRVAIKKAPGGDEIDPEIWKYASIEVQQGVLHLFNKVWSRGEIPADWKEAIVIPIYNNGDKNVPSNYRGISLLSTEFKLFATIVNDRLMEWAEEKGKLPDNQMGFRKGRRTIDSVYILHTLVEKQLAKKQGKLYAYYIDLKAAFDSVKKIWELGVRGKMYRMIRAIYKETTNRVKMEEGVTGQFQSKKGVRQGCPLSLLLFNLFIADLEDYLKEKQEEG